MSTDHSFSVADPGAVGEGRPTTRYEWLQVDDCGGMMKGTYRSEGWVGYSIGRRFIAVRPAGTTTPLDRWQTATTKELLAEIGVALPDGFDGVSRPVAPGLIPHEGLPDREGWWWCLRWSGEWEPIFVHSPTGDGLQVYLGEPVSDMPCRRWGPRLEPPAFDDGGEAVR